MFTINEIRFILKTEEDLANLPIQTNVELREKQIRRKHLELLSPFAKKRSDAASLYSARCFEKQGMSEEDIKGAFDIVTTLYQCRASKQSHPQFTSEELQVAVNVFLIDAAHVFEKACRYKDECKLKWEQINNLEEFTSSYHGTTELTFGAAIRIRKDLKIAERIVNFISSVNKSMREKFQECNFDVLDGHRAYINLGKYYK